MHISFEVPDDFDLESPEGNQALEQWLREFSESPGSEWKIWMRDGENGRHGSVYLFDSQEALEKHLNSKSMDLVREKMEDISIQTYDIMEELSQKTNAPV